jgi:hypothetical protein
MTPALAAHAGIHTCTLHRAGRPGVTSPPRFRRPHTQEAGARAGLAARAAESAATERPRSAPDMQRPPCTIGACGGQQGPASHSTPASRAAPPVALSQRAGHACRNFSWRGQGRGRGQHAHGRACREAFRSSLKTALKHARVPGCCPPSSPNGSPSRWHTSPNTKNRLCPCFLSTRPVKDPKGKPTLLLVNQ